MSWRIASVSLRRRQFCKPSAGEFSDLHQVISRAVGSLGISLLGKRHILGGKQRDFQQQLPGSRRRRTALKEATFIWRARLLASCAGERFGLPGGMTGKLGHMKRLLATYFTSAVEPSVNGEDQPKESVHPRIAGLSYQGGLLLWLTLAPL
jgi:hypothetical protein